MDHGCRRVGWRDWARRRHEDPIQAAARVALADAPTQRAAAILLDQFHGALRHALVEIHTALASGDAATAAGLLDTLLARAPLGQHLVRAWRVVLAGRPNVGKSTLVNAMLGYPRAIVHHAPGTTRDVLTADTAIDGWPVELSDTAGLWRGEHAIDRAGVERAEAQAAEADLVVLVFDLARPWSDADGRLLDRWPSALVVHNKADLAVDATGRPEGLVTSALTARGIEALLRAIAERLVPRPPPPARPCRSRPSRSRASVSPPRRCPSGIGRKRFRVSPESRLVGALEGESQGGVFVADSARSLA